MPRWLSPRPAGFELRPCQGLDGLRNSGRIAASFSPNDLPRSKQATGPVS